MTAKKADKKICPSCKDTFYNDSDKGCITAYKRCYWCNREVEDQNLMKKLLAKNK